MKAYATPGESDAMQIGRDDFRDYEKIRLRHHLPYMPQPACPFPQGSEDAREWQEGWNRERDGK